LTAFLYILSELYKMAKRGELRDTVYAVYVSPLRSLNNDIRRNLETPLREISEMISSEGREPPEVRVDIRTGDTTQSERSRMLRRPPHILITTPESLALIITAPKFRERLRSVRWVIIDEVHSLCENKRGVHLALSHNDDGSPRECVIVDARFVKEMDLRLYSPVKDLIYTDSEEKNRALYEFLRKVIDSRSGAERVAYHLVKHGIVSEEELGVHHSSLSREVRFDIEERLRVAEEYQ